MYLFLSSKNDISSLYPFNSPWDFICEFKTPIILDQNKIFEIALTEIHSDIKIENEQMFVYCDIIENCAMLNCDLVPMIRMVRETNISFSHLYYMKVRRHYINRIRIRIRDLENNTPNLNINHFMCVFHLMEK